MPMPDKTRLSFGSSSSSATSKASNRSEIESQVEKENSIRMKPASVYKNKNGFGHIAMVTPLASQVAKSIRAALQHLGWRKVSIITIGNLLSFLF